MAGIGCERTHDERHGHILDCGSCWRSMGPGSDNGTDGVLQYFCIPEFDGCGSFSACVGDRAAIDLRTTFAIRNFQSTTSEKAKSLMGAGQPLEYHTLDSSHMRTGGYGETQMHHACRNCEPCGAHWSRRGSRGATRRPTW